MTDVTVAGSDIEALATKLEAMTDQFDESELAALQALFHLAGAAVGDAAAEVEGFAGAEHRSPTSFTLPAVQTQGILIGLNQAFGQGRVGGIGATGLALGDGSVRK